MALLCMVLFWTVEHWFIPESTHVEYHFFQIAFQHDEFHEAGRQEDYGQGEPGSQGINSTTGNQRGEADDKFQEEQLGR